MKVWVYYGMALVIAFVFNKWAIFHADSAWLLPLGLIAIPAAFWFVALGWRASGGRV